MSRADAIVTIAVPAHNAAATIQRTLDSILHQSERRLEVIVSDNHSTDATVAIVEREYGARGVRVVTCPIVPRDQPYEMALPVIDNFNSVLGYGTGRYLAIYHADDLYDPTIVERQVAVFEARPTVGAVFTTGRSIDSAGRPVSASPPRPGRSGAVSYFRVGALVDALLRHGSFLMTPTFMARRTVLEKVGPLTRKYGQAADYEWWLRFATESEVAVINDPLFSRRLSVGQDSYHGREVYRTQPLPLFRLMDDYLERSDVAPVVSDAATTAHRVGRGADQVRIAGNLLISGEDGQARRVLGDVLGGLTRRDALSVRGSVVWTTASALLLGSTVGVGARLAGLLDSLREARLGRATRRPRGSRA